MDKLIIIAGPTASGKSAAAVAMAKRCNGSIISADSMQVYRGMDIGSAKITTEEMQDIPHYLIDIADPSEAWNVVRFQQEAQRAAEEITAAGRLPLVVGGTGFYIQALLYGIDFTDTQEDTAYREDLRKLADTEGPEALHRLLAQTDPASAAAIHPNNVKRVIRALEYARETGGQISKHNASQRQRQPVFDAVYYVLTRNREKLYERIDARVDDMMEEGLLDEVLRLKDAGFSSLDVSMQGLGYKQLLQYLEGTCSLSDAVAQIKLQTRHFAKRQLTWFKREKNVVWVNMDDYTTPEEAADFMLAGLPDSWNLGNYNSHVC